MYAAKYKKNTGTQNDASASVAYHWYRSAVRRLGSMPDGTDPTGNSSLVATRGYGTSDSVNAWQHNR
jgi:hypothetical protein